jgi:hypothetical protein
MTPSSRPSIEKSASNVDHVEDNDAFANEILQKYPLLVGKSQEELAALNKKVLKLLDWKFLPCITIMLLMK